MLNRTHITLLVILSAAVWGISLWALSVPLNFEHSKPFAITVGVISFLSIAFDRWLWKWRIFRGWLVNRPVINGTWAATLKSDWEGSGTKNGKTIPGKMAIQQTFSKLTARLYTKESSSFLVAHKIEEQNDGVFQLFGTYQNNPRIDLRGEKSEIHYGALMLEIRGNPSTSLVGHYWTDRGTRGSLSLTDRRDEIVTEFS